MSVYKKPRGQLCDTCENACGGCPWTEVDGETGKVRAEPVPGWTAEAVDWKPFDGKTKTISKTYIITACPLYTIKEQVSTKKPHLWRYTKPVMSIDNYTGKVIVYETIECVVRAGFDVDKATACLLSKHNTSHKGNRFFPAIPEYISPCFLCQPKRKKKCTQDGRTCNKKLAFQRARMKDKVRIISKD